MAHSDETARLEALERELAALKEANSSRRWVGAEGLRSRLRYVLFFGVVLALTITGVATGVTGDPIREGQRNPSSGFTTSETFLAGGNADGFAARLSNFNSGDGGGVASGCRSSTGNEPCLQVGNLNNGLAFILGTNGSTGGRIDVGGPNAKPFTTNATGVATGLNADQVDGMDASDLQSGPATVGAHWGPVARNIIGSAVNELRNGPFISPPGAGDAPPFGDGSLGLETKDGTEKATFGNEVDFVGDNVTDLTDVGFRVYQTGENNSHGGTSNLPNITLEVDPTGVGDNTGPNFSSLVFVPSGPTPVNRWSGYIDGTSASDGSWYFTNGTTGSTTGCNQTTMCSYSALQSAVQANYPDMDITSVQVAKGRDQEWQGAVDGLRINDNVYDFELFGVRTEDATP